MSYCAHLKASRSVITLEYPAHLRCYTPVSSWGSEIRRIDKFEQENCDKRLKRKQK